jgi:uncharacterized protein
MISLTDIEARIIGCLSEKEETTPDYYPLTLNSLTLACNQKSNRSPVVNYEEEQVARAIESLREKKMVFRMDIAGSRVPKFKHRIEENLILNKAEKVLLTVLLLRGAQTLGELRTRSDRMHKFEELLEVESALTSANDHNDGLLIKILPPQPGQKEKRYVQLLCEPEISTSEIISDEPVAFKESLYQNSHLEDRISELESEIKLLKAEFAEFKKQFE